MHLVESGLTCRYILMKGCIMIIPPCLHYARWSLLQGWFTDTELYYGYHVDGVIQVVPGLRYDMRYAYILAFGSFFLLSVIILAVT